MKVEELMSFDACIEAANALATSGNEDCSVLVSADGELLIVPHQQQQQQEETPAASQRRTPSSSSSSSSSKQKISTSSQAQPFWQNAAANELGEEYASAIMWGNDLQDDKKLNGFSAKGYSMPAASLAVQQSADGLAQFTACIEALVQQKQNGASQQVQLLQQQWNPMITPDIPSVHQHYQRFLRDVFPDETRLELTPARVGPLSSPGTTVNAALTALEQYYVNVAEADANIYSSSALNELQSAQRKTQERCLNRQIAIQEMMRRSTAMEDELLSCKQEAQRKWDQVHAAEVKVTQSVEKKRMERNRLREQQRLEQLKHDAPTTSSTRDPSEIWDLVNAATAEMDEGSFAPMDIPQLPIEKSFSWESSSSDKQAGTGVGGATAGATTGEGDTVDDPSSVDASAAQQSIAARLELEELRYELEEEYGLPELRRAALSAEEAVENVSNSLLSVLSNFDTTMRSSRLAAETCLIGAGQAEASFLRTLIRMERESIAERQKQLDELEKVVDVIDVRADLNHYITLDKKQPGGQSFLGEDDDGGVASALAILNEHTDGDIASESRRLTEEYHAQKMEGVDEEADDSSISPEYLEEAVEKFFENNPLLFSSAPDNEKTKEAKKEFEATLEKLCTIGKDKSSKARSRRSTICYTMNAKKNSHSKIQSKIQFDGLCRLFSDILSGCGTDSRGVSNAKVLMNLSQHFYIREKDKDGKRKEVYIKSRILKHPMWEKDEFWDQALTLAVGESLTHSGVMSNFERASNRIVTATTKKRSEWTQTHKTRWHDLTVEERYEAASQVHAVVFAQLGTMSQTMMEFGCSVEHTSAFVRRMSIRNQLPMSQRSTLLKHLKKNKSSSSASSPESSSSSSNTKRQSSSTSSSKTKPVTTAQRK
jgi:hypothetical protein